MTTVILVLVLGILWGGLLRKRETVAKASEHLTTAATWILLFLLGLSLGGQPKVLTHIASLGLQALTIGTAAMAGSILICSLLCRRFFRENGDAQ